MNVGEDSLFAVLADHLVLDIVELSGRVEGSRHSFERRREDMDVDIAATANMPRQRAADQAGAKVLEQPHESQRRQPHLSQVLLPIRSLVQGGKPLDLVADFGI